MEPREIAESFAAAFNKGDLEGVASYLSEDFEFSGPVPEPMTGEQWLGLSRTMRAAFPDLQYNLRILDVDGNTVRSTTQLSGTHTGDFDLSAQGMGVIPPTGKSFSNPMETGHATVEGGKLTSFRIDAMEGSGLPGILKQLGVQMPAP